MARIARVVVPGVFYHVTHRGNRRAAVFFSDDDRQYYLALLAQQAEKHGLEIWSWCLMTNHKHLLVCLAFVKDIESRLGRLLQKPLMGRPRQGSTPEHFMEDLFA